MVGWGPRGTRAVPTDYRHDVRILFAVFWIPQMQAPVLHLSLIQLHGESLAPCALQFVNFNLRRQPTPTITAASIAPKSQCNFSQSREKKATADTMHCIHVSSFLVRVLQFSRPIERLDASGNTRFTDRHNTCSDCDAVTSSIILQLSRNFSSSH